MNKLKYFLLVLKYALKYIALLAFYILKFMLTIIPVLLAELFKLINQRLRFSITFKTTSTYALLFTTILLLLGTGISCAFSFFLLHQTSISLTENSQVITGYINENPEFPRDEIDRYAKIEGISVIILDNKGHPVYTRWGFTPPTSLEQRVRLFKNSTLDSDYIYVKKTIQLKSGSGKMEVAKNLTVAKSYVIHLMIVLAAGLLLAIIICIIIGAVTSRKMLRPIYHMTRTARSISAGDLDTRLDPVDSHDELKELAATFNEMLDRIQSSFEQQNVFVSDASHELRTPIAVIQGYANLLQRWGKENPEVLEESIQAIKGEADYMKELVEKLLFLASADKKKQHIEIAPVDLRDLLEEVVRESQLIDSNHHISSAINDNISLNGDRALLKQALRIFVDNSRKFTPSGGFIKLNGSIKGENAVITVEDNGCGIAADDLPFIFNRFYKSDKSRTREGSGVGLGLSIAKWIIDQHRGELKAESTPQQGTKIILSLPLP